MGESPDTSTAPIRKRRWRWVRRGMGLLLVAWIVMGIYHSYKPLPAGISTLLPVREAQQRLALVESADETAPKRYNRTMEASNMMRRKNGQIEMLIFDPEDILPKKQHSFICSFAS